MDMLNLRWYQGAAVRAVWEHLAAREDNPCVVLPVAAGKTPVMSALAREAVERWGGRVLILAHVKELLQQTASALGRWAPGLGVGVYSAGLGARDLGYPVTVAGIQSVYERAEDLGKIDLCLVDECFTGETEIQTTPHPKKINAVRCGDLVYHAAGIGRVDQVFRRPAHEIVEIEFESGRKIRCTPNHRFFTTIGWVKAEALDINSLIFGIKELRELWEEVQSEKIQATSLGYERIGMDQMCEILLKGMSIYRKENKYPDEATGCFMENNRIERKKGLCFLRKGIRSKLLERETNASPRMVQNSLLLHFLLEEIGKSDEESIGKKKGIRDTEKNRPQTYNSRREWAINSLAAAEASFNSRRWMDRGICCQNWNKGTRNPNALQNRHCESSKKDINRGGRSFPLFHPCEGKGRKEGKIFSFDRVVSVSNIKLKSPEIVYNLHISGHPSFFANGKLVHNCHRIPADGEGMYRTLLAGLKRVNSGVRLVGLTATPYRTSSGLICAPENLLNFACYEIGVKQLIHEGFLSKLKSKSTRLAKVDTSGLHVRAGEYVAEEVEQLVDREDVVALACMEIAELAATRKSVLVFCAGVDHAGRVARTLAETGTGEVAVVTGETPADARASVIERFKAGALKYLVNVNVLTEGFDAPNIDCVAILRPTMSPGLFYQMCGRGFRLAEGKSDCLVLDFGENVLRHGPVDKITPVVKKGPGTGEAPWKECPACQEVIEAARRTCPECGYEFPAREAKHAGEASENGIVSGDDSKPEEYEVLRVEYWSHKKKDATEGHPPTLWVQYDCGFMRASEWVCFEHHGYARTKAEAWWRKRSQEPCPATVDRALAEVNMGAVLEPTHITLKPDGRYLRVVSARGFRKVNKEETAANTNLKEAGF